MFFKGSTGSLPRHLVCLALLILSAAAATAVETSKSAAAKIDFNRDVRPILSENCYKCHGPDESSRKAKLRFDLRAEALKPAKSGDIAIVPNAPEKSALIERITAKDPDDRMPPASTGKTLSAAQIETLRKWIAQGAPYAMHWSYVKPVRPPLPEVKNRKWSRTAPDRFILARLEQEKLKPSPEADRYTLIRRVSLDLTGLPPTLEEVDRFVKDKDPHAYENLVDRILAKPAFGEHWARLWLDLARYADSAGYADDPPRTIWAYRDYVIKAFNQNKSFDRFTIEQIAGDLLGETNEEDEVATAFHRNTMTNNEGGTTDEEFRNAAVVDRANTTMAVWMATSMGCAQCHTHKYDPITQHEYFSFFAFFNNSADADLKDESPVLELFTPQQKEQRVKLQGQIADIERAFKEPSPASLARQTEWEQNLPGKDRWTVLEPSRKRARGDDEVTNATPTVVLTPKTNAASDFREFVMRDKRLTGVQIEVLPAESGVTNAAFSISHIGATLLLPATNRPAARFVRLELPGPERMLSIAEVEVIHGSKNIALEGVATQSSTGFDGPAKLAIDGKTDGDFDHKSTTHTESSENPWWEVDLKQPQSIDRITVWNRTDHDLQARMKDLRIIVLDENRKPTWERTDIAAPKQKVAFSLTAPDPIKFTAVLAEPAAKDTSPADLVATPSAAKRKSWDVNPAEGKTNSVTLLIPRSLDVPEGAKLQLVVEHSSALENCAPAQLRISATSDERFPDYARVPASILETLRKPSGDQGKDERAAVTDYYRTTADPTLKVQRAKLADVKKELAAIRANTVPVMRELPADKKRTTHLQYRGNYQALGEVVSMAVPAVFQPLPRGETTNRLSLAHWLVDKDNPLTARVLANRLWEQIFGVGIVRTSDDFGSQGDVPNNPQLLDWLACQLRDGSDATAGNVRPWDVKAYLKLLVTSAAYRQTSRVTPELQERDPDNLLLARGPRFRVSAEVIRDQALAASGLLSSKMYGPPVRPPRPSLGLSAAFGGSLDWQTSEGEDHFRRALYVEWRRTSPYPSMATFDAPNREVCALRRPRSNTPLQALVILNDPVYVEAAQALGRRIAAAPGSNAEKISHAFRLCLARPPHAAELARLVQFYDQARKDYAAKPEQARQMIGADAKKDASAEDVVSLAACTAVGNVLLNLDEMLMKP